MLSSRDELAVTGRRGDRARKEHGTELGIKVSDPLPTQVGGHLAGCESPSPSDRPARPRRGSLQERTNHMELDIKALDLLPAQMESDLARCEITCPEGGTCSYTCKVTHQ
jgi:hypothetical protein